MKNSVLNERNYALDILRIFACFLVVLLHVCGYGIVDASLAVPKTIFSINDYQIYNFCSCVSMCAVPSFIMISGSFLLDPNISISSEKLKHQIVKIVKLFLFFSLVGILLDFIFKSIFDSYYFNLLGIIKKLLLGEGHLWYLYMILGLYILTPILRRISSDNCALNEFIIIGLFISVVANSISTFFSCEILSSIINKLHLDLVSGYSIYYLIGYKLKTMCKKYDKYNNLKTIIILIIVFILSVLITFYLTAYNKIINNSTKDLPFYSSFFITSFLEASSLFYISLIVNEIFQVSNKCLIKKMASYTTGIYCIHYYVISYLLKFSDFNFIVPIRIFILTSLTIIISIFGTFICKKLPILKDII